MTATGRLPAPTTLRGLLSDRLSQLPPATLDVLAIAATCRPADARDRQGGRGPRRERGAARRRSPRASSSSSGGRIRFSHPLLAVVVHAELLRPSAGVRSTGSSRRCSTSPSSARCTSRSPPPGPTSRTAAELAARGRARARARRLARGRGAGASTRAGSRRPSSAAAARERALASADYAFAAGDIRAARAILDGQAATAPAGAPRAQALVRLALLDTYDGELASARERADAALAEGAADPALRVVLHRRLALVLLLLVELPAAERHAEAALALARDLGQPATIAQARASLAFLRALRGDQGAGEALERIAGDVSGRRAGDDRRLADGDPRAAADVRRRPRRRAGAVRGVRRRRRRARRRVQPRRAAVLQGGAGVPRGPLRRGGRDGRARARGVDADRAAPHPGRVAVRQGARRGAPRARGRGASARPRRGSRSPRAPATGSRRRRTAGCSACSSSRSAASPRRPRRSGGSSRSPRRPASGTPGVLPVGPDAAEALLGAGDIDAAEAVLARLEARRGRPAAPPGSAAARSCWPPAVTADAGR